MSWIQVILSPITLTFLIIVAGYYLGRIRAFNISLDLAAVLIAAVAAGAVFTVTPLVYDGAYMASMQSNMKTLSSLGTSLFVSAIGIISGYSVRKDSIKSSVSYTILGAAMTVCGMIAMKVISAIDSDISYSSLLGILCGALTSTPGLSAVCELPHVISEEATLGYGSAYLFGVMFAVLFVQIITRKDSSRTDNVQQAKDQDTYTGVLGGLIQICLTVVIGNLIGSIELPIIKFSLGSLGGILCAGILVGCIVQSLIPGKRASEKSIGLYRNLGLVLFFVGSGVPAGIRFEDGFHLKWIIYGVIITVAPILAGYLMCKVILKTSDRKTASIIAGGMTSTPAIGVLLKNQRAYDLSLYSSVYIGALLMMTIGVRAL